VGFTCPTTIKKEVITIILTFLTARCIDFIKNYADPRITEDPQHGKHKYMQVMVSDQILIKLDLATSGEQRGEAY